MTYGTIYSNESKRNSKQFQSQRQSDRGRQIGALANSAKLSRYNSTVTQYSNVQQRVNVRW